jgi:hypothetical protein
LKQGYDEKVEVLTNLMSANPREHNIVSKPDPKNTDLPKLAGILVMLMEDWETAMQLIYLCGA